MFWNYAVNLVENTHAKVWLKSHFAMGVLLWICCIFSEHLFVRTPLEGCFFILQVNWKKRLQYRCFLMSFNSFLQTPFLQNTSRKQLLFYGKHFANKIEKNPEWKQIVRKTTTRKITIYIKSSYCFTIHFTISLSFLSFPWCTENTSF